MEKKGLALNNSGVILTEDHRYWLGEKQLSGITGIISRQLFPNKYSAVSEQVLKAAANRGTKVHESLQVYDMFGEVNSIEAGMYAKLKKTKKFEVIDSEYIVTDYENFATPIDKVVVFPDTPDNTVDLADVKNTFSLDKDSLSWQLSICKYLFKIVNPDVNIGKFYAIWTRNGVSLHPIDEIPQEEVIELLNCEKEGRQYVRKDIVKVDDEEVVDIVRQMSDVLVEIAELEAKRDAFKRQLEEISEAYGFVKLDNEYFTITRVDGYKKELFDSKKFKEEHADLYNQFVKYSDVKPSIRIKLK